MTFQFKPEGIRSKCELRDTVTLIIISNRAFLFHSVLLLLICIFDQVCSFIYSVGMSFSLLYF